MISESDRAGREESDAVLDRSPVHSGARVRPRVLIGLALLAGSVGVAALSAWVTYLVSFRPLEALSITACAEGTYEVPEAGERGPGQDECEVPFDARGDSWPVDESFVVEGQVCNDSSDQVVYTVTVSWEPVRPATFAVAPSVVAEIPYPPGCNAPYRFEFQVAPEIIAAGPDATGSYGLWRLVGRAVPVADGARAVPYSWVSAATVELVTPGS